MTNEEIEGYPFKHYSLGMSLTQASSLLRGLLSTQDQQLNSASPNYEMRSEIQAEAKGITRWVNYVREVDCKKPKHFARGTFIKTPLGWMQMCCAKELGLERLPNTYIQPSEQEIMAIYADKKHELELLVEYKQSLASIKSAATRKANAEKIAKAKALKIANKAAMTPEQILDKKMARAEKRAEKRLKEALLVSLKPH